jgi:uncharacterized protein YndB with AHSA1/START domain
MGREFEVERELEVDATPDEVWEAIATGPGIDAWFMGRNEVEPGEGGVVRTAFGGYAPAARITAWEPQRRLAYRNVEDDDGGFVAYEFLITGRAGASTHLRVATSGFLSGEDWEDEYEAMLRGGELFHATLASYLTHFRDRTAVPITAFGPAVDDWQRTRAALHHALGPPGTLRVGTPVRVTPEGLPAVRGTVYAVNADTVGVRAPEGMYRFMRGFQGPLIASHHLFTPPCDASSLEACWRTWLEHVVAASASASGDV